MSEEVIDVDELTTVEVIEVIEPTGIEVIEVVAPTTVEVIEVIEPTMVEAVEIVEPVSYEVIEIPELVGQRGPKGDPGNGGFEFEQTVPSASWTIPHEFDRRPSVTIYIGDEQVDSDVSADDGYVSIVFPAPTVGSAVLT